MPKFSIVIPCYNSFKFMDKCLETLENQTFTDFEVILIDDFSTDDTFENLDKYVKTSKLNIKLLKNVQNLGPGKTRNIGIENSEGTYITFIDADDYIEKDTLEILNNIIEKEKVDCVIYDYYYKTTNNKVEQKTLLKGNSGIVEKKDALIYTTGSTWCKVYLLEKIKENKIEFPDLKRNEDMVFNKLAISVCDKIYYCDKNLYNYINTEGSLVNTPKFLDENNQIIGFEIIEKRLKDKYQNELEAIFLKEFLYAVIMNMIILKRDKKNILKKIKDAEIKYPNIYKNESIKYLKTYQKICLIFIKHKWIFGLKVCVKAKKIIQKVR